MSLAEFNKDLYRNNANTPWRPDVEARFIELWRRGDSASNIAVFLGQEFGVKLTRNACIGKAYRLAMPHRKRQPACNDPIRLAARMAHRREYLRKWRANNRPRVNSYDRGRYWRQKELAARKAERELAPVIEDFAIPTPQRKTIFELGPHDCRWPIGEPKSDLFFFCGAVAEEKRPYCSAHCRRAYVEIRPR